MKCWLQQAEEMFQDNGGICLEVVPLAEIQFSIQTYIYNWTNDLEEEIFGYKTSFLAPSYQRDWNLPDMNKGFAVSGDVYDSCTKSTDSILHNNCNCYLDHVIHDSTHCINCAISFEYEFDMEVELGVEVFWLFYHEQVW